jgi:hypothetical protein
MASEIVADGPEMLRRAERAVGQAVRNGQDAGEIMTRQDGYPRSDYVARRGGVETVVHVARRHDIPSAKKVSPDAYLPHGSDRNASYRMADASDERFEGVLAEARAEGNLSRANVVRKVKGQPSPQTRDARADLIADLAAKGNAPHQRAVLPAWRSVRLSLEISRYRAGGGCAGDVKGAPELGRWRLRRRHLIQLEEHLAGEQAYRLVSPSPRRRGAGRLDTDLRVCVRLWREDPNHDLCEPFAVEGLCKISVQPARAVRRRLAEGQDDIADRPIRGLTRAVGPRVGCRDVRHRGHEAPRYGVLRPAARPEVTALRARLLTKDTVDD